MPSPTPGFVSLQQYLTANQGALGGMTKTLADAGTKQAQGAENEAGALAGQAQPGVDPSTMTGYQKADTDAQNADTYLKSLGSYGGLYSDVQNTYGKGGAYSPGDASFDATLLGTSGPQQQFQGLQNQYGGLDSYLQNTVNYAQQRPERQPKSPNPEGIGFGAPIASQNTDGEAVGGQRKKGAQSF